MFELLQIDSKELTQEHVVHHFVNIGFIIVGAVLGPILATIGIIMLKRIMNKKRRKK